MFAQLRQCADNAAKLDALSRSQAVIEFAPDGTILTANENFLRAMGYSLAEIQGKHHAIFVEPCFARSSDYKAFWAALARGELQTAEYRRFNKAGDDVWIQATYNPIVDKKGRVVKVVKYASYAGQIAAINKSQAVIEFNPDGTIITANENFLGAVGYALDEIQGKHHGMFADPVYRASAEYKAFWDALRRGEYQSGEFKRRGKGDRILWLQASYNPIYNLQGQLVKVVKFAADITGDKMRSLDTAGQLAAIHKSQAVIEFNLDGTIITANPNFLAAVGYTLDEIKGRHHSMFVEPAYRASGEYLAFWEALNRGEYQTAEYLRHGKGGKEIWIQASYNPIFDDEGKPFKVVKYASDITKQKLAIDQINALISSATRGDLDQRIDVAHFDGFYKDMTHSMNGLIEAVGQPIAAALDMLNGLSRGDLTVTMSGQYSGAFGEMCEALEATTGHLRSMVGQIIETASSVKAAASEIAAGSADLSMRTEQQAARLEQTAASMEQITAAVRNNSQNANKASELSSGASTVADAGGKVVEEAVTAMGNIEKSSQKISDIIGVIDEIAFQTNLLALNAAVEAARAGDAGRGFAVVASEVRVLAGRSASASKEIKTLINESASEVKTGAQLVNKAGDALSGIVSSVKQVAGIVSDIATASTQQANGIDEVNGGVAQMDEVTQQNAALVQENTAAAQSMLEQAHALEKLIGFFRIEQDAATAGTLALVSAARSKADPITLPRMPVGVLAKASNGHGNGHDIGWEEF